MITFIRAMQQTSRPPPRPPTQYVLPPERKFVQLPLTTDFEQTDLCTATSFGKFRVLQFNMLADGLSGLRQDLGAFSRVTADDMNWDKRGKLLLHEILQYDPDIITLQECDHYYDCFLPELNARGYDGMFAPKPASACLEVSDNSDGCAIFVRRSKMYITSFEVSLLCSDLHPRNNKYLNHVHNVFLLYSVHMNNRQSLIHCPRQTSTLKMVSMIRMALKTHPTRRAILSLAVIAVILPPLHHLLKMVMMMNTMLKSKRRIKWHSF